MTVSSVVIKPDEKNGENGWYRMTITSQKNHIGETTIELLLSEDTLRWIRHEIDKITPAATNEDEPEWLKAFRDMDK